jgi:hypothetical protein
MSPEVNSSGGMQELSCKELDCTRISTRSARRLHEEAGEQGCLASVGAIGTEPLDNLASAGHRLVARPHSLSPLLGITRFNLNCRPKV